jgi:hypothetical protein
MKFKYLSLVTVFLFGWLLGSLFTLLYLFNMTRQTPTSITNTSFPSFTFFRNIPENRSSNQFPSRPILSAPPPSSSYLPLHESYEQNTLPLNSFHSNLSFHDYSIYLDWPLDEKLFTFENYLALESLLVSYPSAQFRILLPTSKDSISSKVGNLLSSHHFVRYKKLGYDIQVTAVGQMIQSRGPGYGTDYWMKWSQRCCESCDAECR